MNTQKVPIPAATATATKIVSSTDNELYRMLHEISRESMEDRKLQVLPFTAQAERVLQREQHRIARLMQLKPHHLELLTDFLTDADAEIRATASYKRT